MDERRFDALTRRLAARASRRSALATASGLLAGLLLPDAARAACPPDQLERRGVGCICKATGRPPGPTGCPCPPGQTRCAANGPCQACCDDTDCPLGWCDGLACQAPFSAGACGRAAQCTSGHCCPDGACGTDEGTPCNPEAHTCCSHLVCGNRDGQTVCRTNAAPVAHSGNVDGMEDEPCVPVTLTGTDPDGDPLTFVITTLPTNGKLYTYAPDQQNNVGDPITTTGQPITGTVSATEALLCYNPDPDLFGTPLDTFTFTVTDPFGASSDPATLTINIISRPDIPQV